VIRGDDHVNNTPRQINIFKALGKDVPVYAHLPTVLNELGEKMSKRSGAKAVTQYAAEGYLPDAMVNYLARLGWSHGDDEIFSREQFVAWFNLDHLGKSAAQFDEAKLRWVNAQHLKAMSDAALAHAVKPFLSTDAAAGLDDARLARGCGLFKDRCSTLVELAHWLQVLVKGAQASSGDVALHVTDAVRPALALLADAFTSCEWNKAGIAAAIKQVLDQSSLKMPQLAMPVRVLVMGTPQTPSLDAILELMVRDDVIARLKS
jgi:glutamyl-tRNA synthetase